MRTSILSRSVIAVASLAIGSVALAAVPATAATASGITRDQVLTAANQARNINSEPEYVAVLALLREIARPTCGLTVDDYVYYDFNETPAGQAADGMLIKAYIENDSSGTRAYRQCAFAVLASTNPTLALSGSLTLSGTTAVEYPDGPKTVLAPATSALSGDAFVSTPIVVTGDTYIDDVSFTANGSATRNITETTTTKVKVTVTKSQKKAAKSKYAKALKSAKKSYTKTLKKAGKSKAKKSAAKKAYNKKKASAKKKYASATATHKFVKTTSIRTESVPFTLATPLYPPSN